MTAKEYMEYRFPRLDMDTIVGKFCPEDFGLHDRCIEETHEEKDCKKCWDLEIPDTTDTPTQPQILDSGNSEDDTRKKILEDAIYCVCTDRKQQYGKPENSFSVIADFWSMYIRHKYDIDIELTAADAAMMLALFKVARGVTALKQKLDTYVDICGYAACAGELECKEEK